MGICEGSEVEYKDIMPEELQKLRRVIAQYITPKIGEPAAALPEGFPLYAQIDPLSLMARDIMFGMGGYQQQPVSPYGTYQWSDYIRPQPTPVGPVGPTPQVTPAVTPQPAGPGYAPQPTVSAEPGPTVAAIAQPGPVVPIPTPLPEPPVIPGPEPGIEPQPTPMPWPEPSPYPEPSAEPKVQPYPYVEPAPGPEPGPAGPTGPTEPIVSPNAEVILVGPRALVVVPGPIIRPRPEAIDMGVRPLYRR